jgi:hypothetical protein
VSVSPPLLFVILSKIFAFMICEQWQEVKRGKWWRRRLERWGGKGAEEGCRESGWGRGRRGVREEAEQCREMAAAERAEQMRDLSSDQSLPLSPIRCEILAAMICDQHQSGQRSRNARAGFQWRLLATEPPPAQTHCAADTGHCSSHLPTAHAVARTMLHVQHPNQVRGAALVSEKGTKRENRKG